MELAGQTTRINCIAGTNQPAKAEIDGPNDTISRFID
jgi:hypothetical protein